MSELLGTSDAADYLRRRGLIGAHADITVRELSGGVSNVVLAIDGDRRLICKQSLPQLRVSDTWLADRTRILAEAEALRLTRDLTGENVPGVLDSDEDRCTLCIERAPEGWSDWKRRLLAGSIDQRVATTLGALLATWQNATSGGDRLSARLRRYEAFDQLRIDPYHRTVARRHPELGAAVTAVIEEMAQRRWCLTHGDFSPKNVLVEPDGPGLWVIDFEVAHLGDPAFDVAFLLCHLLLKSIHRPQDLDRYAEAGLGFAARWQDQVDPAIHPGWPAIGRQLGCLLLARVEGKSPAEYLDTGGRESSWRLGSALLTDPPASASEAWTRRKALIP